MIVFKNIYFNVIILYSLSYILKCKTKYRYILLSSIIGSYRIFFNYYIFDLIMLLSIYKNIKIDRKILNYIIICILLKGINYNFLLSPIILFLYIKQINCYSLKKYYKTTIVYNTNRITLYGLMDTGNNLKYFNKPVIIINNKLIKDVNNYFYIPYKTINNSGIIKAFKPEYIIINNKKIYNIVIGLGNQDFDLILNSKIMEDI